MKNLRIGIVAVFLSLMAGAHAEPPEGYRFLSSDEGLRVASQRGQRIFLYLGRYGCTWCDRTNQEAFSDREVHRLYTNNYMLVYLDTEGGNRLHLPSGERLTEADLAARLKVLATPLFVFLESDVKPIVRTAGVKTVRDLVDMHQYVAEGHFRQLSLQEYQDGQRDSD